MRYNIFNKAHLPLKNALISACISITRAVDGQVPVTGALIQIKEALRVFNEQVVYETLHILPFVFEYEPSVSATFTGDHDKAARLALQLQDLVGRIERQQDPLDQECTLKSILNNFNDFILINFNHMDDEEAVLNEILWRYYSDRELLQLEEKIDILPHLVPQQHQKNPLEIAAAA